MNLELIIKEVEALTTSTDINGNTLILKFQVLNILKRCQIPESIIEEQQSKLDGLISGYNNLIEKKNQILEYISKTQALPLDVIPMNTLNIIKLLLEKEDK